MSNGPSLFVCLECNQQTRPVHLRGGDVTGYRAELSCGCDVGGDITEPMLKAEYDWGRHHEAIHRGHSAACPCYACTTKEVGTVYV